MAIKTAISTDKTADRKDRPKPTMRGNVHYAEVPGHGATDISYTPDQTVRKHELAATSEAKSQGAIVAGKVSDECVDSEPGLANAKRRFAAITKRRKETEAVFAANRKKSSIVK